MNTIYAATEYRATVKSDDRTRTYELHVADNGTRAFWSVKYLEGSMRYIRFNSGEARTLDNGIAAALGAIEHRDRTIAIRDAAEQATA